ncbi:hypothetical protein K8R04_02505 [Candidatus Uhrbacteria bacterium]|nr:hypothetical protein [Candidatus Uhrbacteria bacterium]
MADAAEVLPLPEEEPAQEAPQSDDSAAADDSGKDVSFGTFLTVGPKETRNVTIVGYDSLRDTVRAVRRSGDSVENIQIPYEQYKTIIEAQKESDKATGRTTKKNLSGAVRGFFGKNVSLEGKTAQVIGYDAQNDEVLVNDGAGRRWMKSGEMLRGTQTVSSSAPLPTARSTKTSKQSSRVVRDQGTKVDFSDDASGKAVRQVEVSGTSIQPSNPEITAPLKATTSASASTSTSASASVSTSPASASIRETRIELQSERAASAGATTPQSAIAAVASVAAAIPASDTGAAAIIAAAQNVLAAYGASASAREGQIQQLSGQISEVSNRINDLQQRSRTASAGGNSAQASQLKQQIVQSQADRDSLLHQQTDLQVARINEDNKADQIVQAVQRLEPDASGVVPDDKVAAVQKLLPSIAAPTSAQREVASAAAALPRPTSTAAPRAYAPGIPSRRASATASPSVRTPKPIRPLGGSLSSIGGQAQRAVELGAAQSYDRGARNGYTGAGSEDTMERDSYEDAFATEGGQGGYSGPLDLPERKPQTYAAGAGDEEPEPADIYGAKEEAGRAEMKRIHGGSAEGQMQSGQRPPEMAGRPGSDQVSGQNQDQAPTGPTPQELARASALQQATAQAVQRQGQQKAATSEAGQSESQMEKIRAAKKTISNLIDAFDTAHGAFDVIGILMTIAHLNGRLVLTFFKKDLPFFPQAGFPYECSAIACLDLAMCLSAMMTMLGPVILLAAIIAAISSATFGLSDVIGGWLDLF